MDGVVPVPVKPMGRETEGGQVLIRDGAALGVRPAIQPAPHPQAGGRARRADQVDDHRQTHRLTKPFSSSLIWYCRVFRDVSGQIESLPEPQARPPHAPRPGLLPHVGRPQDGGPCGRGGRLQGEAPAEVPGALGAAQRGRSASSSSMTRRAMARSSPVAAWYSWIAVIRRPSRRSPSTRARSGSARAVASARARSVSCTR